MHTHCLYRNPALNSPPNMHVKGQCIPKWWQFGHQRLLAEGERDFAHGGNPSWHSQNCTAEVPSGELVPPLLWSECEKAEVGTLGSPPPIEIDVHRAGACGFQECPLACLQSHFCLELLHPGQLTVFPHKPFNTCLMDFCFFFFLLGNFNRSRDQWPCPQINSPAEGPQMVPREAP